MFWRVLDYAWLILVGFVGWLIRNVIGVDKRVSILEEAQKKEDQLRKEQRDATLSAIHEQIVALKTHNENALRGVEDNKSRLNSIEEHLRRGR